MNDEIELKRWKNLYLKYYKSKYGINFNNFEIFWDHWRDWGNCTMQTAGLPQASGTQDWINQ